MSRNKSPAKNLRNAKRLIAFLQTKILVKSLPSLKLCPQAVVSVSPKPLPLLTTTKCAGITIPPEPLTCPNKLDKQTQTMNVSQTPAPYLSSSLHSFCAASKPKPPPTKLSLMNIPSNFNIYSRPDPEHIPQLDGSNVDLSTINWPQHDQSRPTSDLLQCSLCLKIFETNEDQAFHNHTKLGREDCAILKSMLP
jgi:hypothetical protein